MGEKDRLSLALVLTTVRFDYQSIDTSANRLYISHMDAGELVVLEIGSTQSSPR